MGESEKPFACPSPGCNMSFTNEDHLVVHKKKHDMILNLGTGKTGVFVADQTPTPTRFIRNCEEVGLFQDLQNVNPFEETFRRAVESGKIGSLPETEIDDNDDTLHTPHVFPHIEDDTSDGRKVPAEDTVAKIEKTEGESEEKAEVDGEITEDVTIIKKTTKTIVHEADTSAAPVIAPTSNSLSINGEEVQLLLKTDDGKLMQLSAIPVCGTNTVPSITTQALKPQTIVIKTDLPHKCPETVQSKRETSRLSLAKMRLREVLSKNDAQPEIERTDQNENHLGKPEKLTNENKDKTLDNHKKQEMLARNRASSMRARAKRKIWIQQLQKSVNSANELNAALQLEIKSLRSEVAKLKTLLLAHKDCPVTKAMEKANGIIVDSKVIPVASQFIQASPVAVNEAVHGVKRKITDDTPAAAKKKPIVLSHRQSLLLPKVEEKNLPLCVAKIVRGPCQTMKILDISQLTEKRQSKQILIVQNSSPRKTQSINSRQIVQVDQSLQLINVASKTTGT